MSHGRVYDLNGDPAACRGKKILFLIHSLHGGGAERMTLNLAGRWAAAGCDVVVATFESVDQVRYVVPAGVRTLSLDASGPSSGLLSALKGNLRRISRVRRLLRRERPDVAIGMMTTSAVTLALARDSHVFAVGAERNYPPLMRIGRMWERLRRWSYGRLDVVTVQTDKGRDWLLRNTRARHVVTVPNSLHLPLARQEPVVPVSDIVPGGRRLLLAVGRLSAQKGLDRLIRAFAEVSTRHPDWTLVILGDGGLRPDLEAMVGQLGLGARIAMPGWAGNLAQWYEAADLFAMTSHYEGFPNVLIEAMAHGCPPLSFDLDTGPRDIITHGHDGLLVPQDDEAAFVRALDALMADEELRRKLATNAIGIRDWLAPERIDALWQQIFSGSRRHG